MTKRTNKRGGADPMEEESQTPIVFQLTPDPPSDDFLKCRVEAINLIKKLNWKNGYFRGDIGHKVIKV